VTSIWSWLRRSWTACWVLALSCAPAPLKIDLTAQAGEQSALVFALPGAEALPGAPFATIDLRNGEGTECFDGHPLGDAPLELTALYYRRPPLELCFRPGCGEIASGPTARGLPAPDRVGVQRINVGTSSASWKSSALPAHIASLEVRRSCRSPSVPAVEVKTGGRFTLVRLADGSVWSFGLNDLGQLGLGDTEPRSVPQRVPLPEQDPAVSISAYLVSACAALASGAVMCWGQADGKIGTGRPSVLSPAQIRGLGRVKQVAVGRKHACALEVEGRVACWGSVFDGDGVFENEAITVGTATDALSIVAGGYHTCVLGHASGLRCFGLNHTAQARAKPSEVLRELTPFGGPPDIVEAALGDVHTVLRTADGRVWFVGYNGRGYTDTSTLGEVPEARGATAISAQGYASCALVEGAAECWGFLITGSPTRYRDVVGIQQLSVGSGSHPSGSYNADGSYRGDSTGVAHVCGIDADGAVVCGGGDSYGQLGDGQNPMEADAVRPLW